MIHCGLLRMREWELIFLFFGEEVVVVMLCLESGAAGNKVRL